MTATAPETNRLPAATNGYNTPVEYVPFGGTEKIKLSVRIVQDLLCVPSKSGKICDERQALKFVMLCRSRALNPFEGDAYLVGFDRQDGTAEFQLITAHQAFLKRAEASPEFDGMESGVIVQTEQGEYLDRVGDFLHGGDVLLGAWATVHLKHRSHPMRQRLNLRPYQKPFGRWRDDPAGQIVKCAEAGALRAAFPTRLGGMHIEQEPRPVEVPATVTTSDRPASCTDALAARLAQRKGAWPDDGPDTDPDPGPAEQQQARSDDPADDPAALEKDDLASDLCQRAHEASRTDDLKPLYGELQAKRDWLGMFRADAVQRCLDARGKELAAGRAGKR
jgi:phage recombination protein Bet